MRHRPEKELNGLITLSGNGELVSWIRDAEIFLSLFSQLMFWMDRPTEDDRKGGFR